MPNSGKAVISVHCHNDLGLAVANSLAAVMEGAGQVECTINGIGERAGNTSLEEIVMGLRTRKDLYQADTKIHTEEISKTSRLVSKITGMVVQPNKAIVGANAFAHTSGIHQDGLLKDKTTYEIMRPEDVGVNQTTLVLGKHSGRHALRTRLAEMGHSLDEYELDKAFARFKELADRKKVITDLDLEAVIADEFYRPRDVYYLDGMQVTCGTMGMPTATVRLRGEDGRDVTQAAVGTGPVHACFRAIDAVVDLPVELLEYTVHAVTEGIDALGEVSVRVRDASGGLHAGYGADTDVLVASAKAYLAALDRVRKERVVAKASEQARLKESA